VFEDNLRAVDLYQRSGFRTEGRLEAEFQEVDGTLRNDLVMALRV
jgi:ribosomal protein S18 acetylase RimI-like enzyme